MQGLPRGARTYEYEGVIGLPAIVAAEGRIFTPIKARAAGYGHHIINWGDDEMTLCCDLCVPEKQAASIVQAS
jgi:hypothetical protein